MKSLVLFSTFVFAVYGQTFQLPHGHQLTELVDQGFASFDRNKDGVLTVDELLFITNAEDANHDGRVTLAEFTAFIKAPAEVATPIFNAYDTDNDGSIPTNTLQQYIHLLDANGDGSITLREYEHYQTTFLECVFGHHTGGHGHGADCSSR